jgi:HEAT repeat protein
MHEGWLKEITRRIADRFDEASSRELLARVESILAPRVDSADDLRALVTGNDPVEARELGLWLLARTGDPNAPAIARQCLHDPEPSMRAEAVRTLALVTDDPETLVSVFENDASAEVRKFAVWALGYCATPPYELLRSIAGNDQLPVAIRDHATEALGRPGANENVASLSELLRDPEEAIAYSAAYALGQIGGPAAEDALQRFLQAPPPGPPRVLAEARRALGFDNRAQPDQW